jgi:RNA polymerase sigma factor (sigma-70 family)
MNDAHNNVVQQTKALSEESERAIYDRIRAGDSAARRELVAPHLAFAAAYVRRWCGCGIEYEDLCQVAAIGLIAAADSFDPDRGAAFRTHAVYHIKSAVIHEIEAQGRSVRLPAYLLRLAGKYRRFASDFLRDHHREPTPTEAAAALSVTVEQIRAMHKAAQPVACLDQPLTEDDDLTLGDTIDSGEDIAEDIADEDARRQLHNDLVRLVGALPADEGETMRQLYFHGRTCEQAAQEACTSVQEIENARDRALRKLRTAPLARLMLSKYRAEIIGSRAYDSSFNLWEKTGSSSTELAAVRWLEKTEENAQI